MSVSGPCQLCGRSEIEDSCTRCGKLVCERHYEEDSGWCVDCDTESRGDRPENVPDEEDMPDGVDTYEF